MRGHIYKRGDTWTYVIYLGRDPVTGKKKQKSKGGHRTKKEAQTKLTEALQALNTGTYIDIKKLTLKDYLSKWLVDYVENNVKYKTRRSYKETVKNHLVPNLGNYMLDKLSPSIIQNYYTFCINETNLSNTSIHYIHKILKQALNQAIKWQIINRNPCDSVTPPKKNKPKHIIPNSEQINLILEECKFERIRTAVFLAIVTGMRRGEICGLKWEDVDLNKGMIYVRDALQRQDGEIKQVSVKSDNSSRAIAISKVTVEYLASLKKKHSEEEEFLGNNYNRSNYICAWEDGRPMTPHYVTKKFRKIRDKLNIGKVRFHDLRHAHATFMLMDGVHPKIVSERLGHSSIGITMDIYSHALPTLQKEAAEKLDQTLSLNLDKKENEIAD